MPLFPVPVDLPPDLADVRAGDLDGDGVEELIFVSRTPASPAPDRVTLRVARLQDQALSVSQEISLGNRAALWDVHGGLWAVTGRGIEDLMSGQLLAELRTPLSGLGPTAPIAADIADDLDGDGRPELFAFTWGALEVYGADGAAMGSIPVESVGALSAGGRGGSAFGAEVRSPPIAFGDADGDGLRDVLILKGDRIEVAFTGPGGPNARRATWRLPLDLDPPPAPGAAVKKEPASAWFEDLDGDGRVDLLVHQWVTEGSFFGATAELVYARGTGAGFASPQRIQTASAAIDVKVLDLEGDGDRDVFTAQVDVGLSNIARALVARSVEVDLACFAMEGGVLQGAPTDMGSFSWPIQDEAFQGESDGDIDGDGIVDLITCDGEGQMALYRGALSGGGGAPTDTAPVTLPPEGRLTLADVDGDGASEILVWGPGQRRGTLVDHR